MAKLIFGAYAFLLVGFFVSFTDIQASIFQKDQAVLTKSQNRVPPY